MAIFASKHAARAQAQANADRFRCPYVVFSDTGGNVRIDRRSTFGVKLPMGAEVIRPTDYKGLNVEVRGGRIFVRAHPEHPEVQMDRHEATTLLRELETVLREVPR